jgi:PPIC-type PPIASE domain
MSQQLEQTRSSNNFTSEAQPDTTALLSFPKATDSEVLTHIRYWAKFAEIATLAEKDAAILANCQKLGITVSDEEWQIAGDAFRQEHKLWGTAETFAWLESQRISIEEWSEGIRIGLLEQKLKEHLFGASVDAAYVNNRDNYRRVALSQILVADLASAWKIVQALREGHGSFCSLAIEHSKGKQSQENGGFVGVRFLVELMPEVAQAITEAKEGEIIGPVQTKRGYHILRVEKWFPTELSQAVREQIMDALFQTWLQHRN